MVAFSYMPFYLIYGSMLVGFVLAVVYGVWVSSRFLRWRLPGTSVAKSRWVALAKQLLGFVAWAYYGESIMEVFSVHAFKYYRWLHAIPLAITLYLMAFALLSHTFGCESARSTARYAVQWIAWDFVTISIPLVLLSSGVISF